MLHLIEGLADDWHRLDERIEVLSSEIGALACGDPACDRLWKSSFAIAACRISMYQPSWGAIVRLANRHAIRRRHPCYRKQLGVGLSSSRPPNRVLNALLYPRRMVLTPSRIVIERNKQWPMMSQPSVRI
jgi:hypothetical protein